MNDELIRSLNRNFPKGECKERGRALVFHAEAQATLKKEVEEAELQVHLHKKKDCTVSIGITTHANNMERALLKIKLAVEKTLNNL